MPSIPPLPRLVSPLRYPGGKRNLTKYVAELIKTNNLEPEIFIEPFCGGAAIAIELLEKELVQNICISDRDHLVGNFWRVVFGPKQEFNELIAWINSSKITIEEWKEVRALDANTHVKAAFKCIFLNRTSFSGVLNSGAGPIGGHKQESKYRIDCRFPKDRIIERLHDLHGLKKHVIYSGAREYHNVTDLIEIKRIMDSNPASLLWYIDPPFFRKAEKLYNHYFTTKEHVVLKDWVLNTIKGNWILSYDDVPECLEIWGDHYGLREVDLRYTASRHSRADNGEKQSRKNNTEVIISDLHNHKCITNNSVRVHKSVTDRRLTLDQYEDITCKRKAV